MLVVKRFAGGSELFVFTQMLRTIHTTRIYIMARDTEISVKKRSKMCVLFEIYSILPVLWEGIRDALLKIFHQNLRVDLMDALL